MGMCMCVYEWTWQRLNGAFDKFKFGMYTTYHLRPYPIRFAEYRMTSFFAEIQKWIFMHYDLKPNSLKCSRFQTVNSIELNFGIHIIGYRPT